MSMVDKATSKRLLSVHGWSGVILGLFLYVVVITGTVAVLAHEIGSWSVSRTNDAAFSQPLDSRVKALAAEVDPKFREDLAIYPNAAGSMAVFFHTHGTNAAGEPDDLGVRFLLEPGTLRVLQRDEGYGTEMPGDRQGALEDFISTLHISLHAPNPIGLYLTGIAGFVMLFAVVSGLILHRHLIKDLFVAPRRSSRLLNHRDRHILAGSWTLPFGFLLAFTGTFFSFAGAIGLPIVAMVAFGGDQVKMIETLVGAPPPTSSAAAPMASLDTILADSRARFGTDPDFINVAHWGKSDAVAQVTHGPIGSSIKPTNLIYDLSTGAFVKEKPDIGTRPSLGSAVFAWMGPLHFGHFAGLLSKAIWIALGLATCYVSLTGLRLWVERRSGSSTWRWLRDVISLVAYGVPVALVGSAAGFLLTYPLGDTVSATARGFVSGLVIAMIVGAVQLWCNRAGLDMALKLLLGLGLASLPLLRIGLGGVGWAGLLGTGVAIPLVIDLAMLTAGGLFLVQLVIGTRSYLMGELNTETDAELEAAE
ncbi:PepSY-associated TM helix domain-containing protein [Sphingomonas sp. 37zxx]|uniref:PepSY-associated TM helix domain-containing protein n=1 Tax=Sphingomonas sp. 37zxx TaxID=1550073 RepID=UPI00053C0041|nr:PepSY-associated TM helix domain-containing protein [Sphingomonas sp. 37zxx]